MAKAPSPSVNILQLVLLLPRCNSRLQIAETSTGRAFPHAQRERRGWTYEFFLRGASHEPVGIKNISIKYHRVLGEPTSPALEKPPGYSPAPSHPQRSP